MAPRTTIHIRPREPEDDAFMLSLSREAFAEYTFSAADKTRAMTTSPGALTFVAIEGEAPTGFVVVEYAGNDAVVSAIAVREAARGRGIGRKLLARAEAAARRMGADRLTLMTSQSNLAALELFLHSGFRMVDRQNRYYARGQDAVRLEKPVD